MPLKIAAKVDTVDQGYYCTKIAPLLVDDSVQFIGEVDQAGKNEFLGKACALLFPVCWPEPFGLVMIEAMACGTPVIALDCGSVREVVAHQETGFVCDSWEEMACAVGRIAEIDRQACRQHVEARFSARAMAQGYEQVYRTLLE